MTKAPGTDEAAFLAFVIVDALIIKLIAKGVLTRADVIAIYEALADSVSEEPRALGKRGAELIREMIAKHKVE